MYNYWANIGQMYEMEIDDEKNTRQPVGMVP